MPTSIELRQERARVVEQTRELVDRAETGSRDLTADERQTYDRLTSDYTSLTERITRQEEQEQRELETSRPVPHPDDPEGRGGGNPPASDRAFRESNLPDDAPARAERMAFLDLVRYGRAGLSPEARALVEDTNGEILVPEALETELRRDIPALAIVRNIASRRQLTSNRVRRRSLDEVTVGWGKLETGTALVESMPDTPTEEYTYAEDLYGLAKIGEDELMDSDVNLEAFVRDSFALAIAAAEDTGFTVGAGHASEEPVGFMTAGGDITAVEAGQDSAITVDDFKTLIYAVPAQARRNGRFVLASATELILSTLKDSNGQYLWQPSNQAGRPNSFLGYPLENQEDVAEVDATGTEARQVAAFGDWLRTYRVYDRLGMTLKRLEELYSEDGMIGFRVHFRVGGDVVNPDWARRLTVPAAGA